MGYELTGHVWIDVDGTQHQIQAASFDEELGGFWKFHGNGFSLLAVANLQGVPDSFGNFPTHLEPLEIEGNGGVEILEGTLSCRRGPLFDIDE